MDISALVEELSRPRAYRGGVERVEVLETHISVLFFAGERVYKLKKPVDLGFVDYTSLERRRHFCEEEVRLGHRLTPRVHLGVVPVVRDAGGTVRMGGAGEVLDYAVEMRRLDERRMLDRLLDEGEVDNGMMDALAALLADFHRRVPTGEGVDEHGTPEAVRSLSTENLDEIEPFVAALGDEHRNEDPARIGALSPRVHSFLRQRARAFLDAETALFERRVAEGRIRDGHGDLHAGNICFGAAGIDVYDCVEFSRRLRCGDVALDFAFLAMDLDFRGFAGFGGYLAHRYAELTDDPELGRLLVFYKSYRATVRGKVAALTAANPGLDERERRAQRARAMAYFHLAAAYELPPALILTAGLPASGKSFLARHLARPFHAVLLQSDVRRKILAGIAPDARAGAAFGAGIYTSEHTAQTYRSLLASATEALARGRTAVVDASFSKRELRAPFLAAAAAHGRQCYVAHVTAPESVALERLCARAADSRAISDADLEVYRRAKDAFEPLTELPPGRLVHIVSGDARTPEEATALLLEAAVAASS